jgi:HD superfamily phosphohydrolase
MAAAQDIFELDTGPLTKPIGEWADRILSPYLRRHPRNPHRDAKLVHDPIGKAVTLFPWEVYIVDSPLLQRLRFIRQLGVGHFLFPTAGYSRFEHSLGCVKAVSTLFDTVSDRTSRPQVAYDGEHLVARRDVVRLAALLHDVGHCIMSHVSEKFYKQYPDVEDAQRRLKRHYGPSVAAAEAVAILVLKSEAFQRLLAASGIRRSVFSEREIIDKVCACIAGSKRRMLPDAYLAEMVNGPVDCDKLDYLARDAHMAGLPISLDIDRLFSKLRIVKTLDEDHGTPMFSLAIVPSGARALEEMLVSRIFLYDKFYYHPKIMAAEELVRRALFYLEKACPALGTPQELLDYGDDEFLSLTGSYLASRYGQKADDPNIVTGCELLARARARDLPKRAFAFAQRFIPDTPPIYGRFVNRGKEDSAGHASRDYIDVDQVLQSPGGADLTARSMKVLTDDLKVGSELFVGYQSASRAAGRMEMLVLLPGDVVETTPDFMFNVSKWSDAYALNKQTSYVFAYDDLAKVHLAAERYFAERRLTFAPKSWVWTKLSENDLNAERSVLPETPDWLPHRLPPNFFTSADTQERLDALRDKFSSYLRSFDSELGPQLVDGWVWQFQDADLQDSAMAFLEHITFVEKGAIIEGFQQAVEKRAELRDAIWVPLRPREGQGKSADLVKYDLQEIGLRMCDVSMLEPAEVSRVGRVVFFDDLLNSGVQAECLLGSWFGDAQCESPSDRDAGELNADLLAALRAATIEFVYYSAHPIGIRRLQAVCDRLGLSLGAIGHRVDTGSPRYTLDGFKAATVGSRERFVAELERRGEVLLKQKYEGNVLWTPARCREFALGFGGMRTTLVYRHSVSTAVPVALWQMSTEIMDPWLPLFPRRWRELKTILDPYPRGPIDRSSTGERLPEYRDGADDE